MQLTAAAERDIPIPDKVGQPAASLTFGKLQEVQAAVDALAVRRARRRVMYFRLGIDAANQLRQFIGQETMVM